MSKIFTEEDIWSDEWTDAMVAKVREIAEGMPDFVYDSNASGTCFYYPDESNPYGCIIGFAARSLGTPFDSSSYEGRSFLMIEGEYPTDDRHYWLNTVQMFQDEGMRWLAAVSKADEQYDVSVYVSTHV